MTESNICGMITPKAASANANFLLTGLIFCKRDNIMKDNILIANLGFYPVSPGMPVYNIGSPLFAESVITLGNGKEFKIRAVNCSFENKYIQSAKLNGEEWNKPWFSHDDISNGGELELVMGNKANREWGASSDAAPPSAEKMTGEMNNDQSR